VLQELTASKRRITDPGTRRNTLPRFNQRRMARPWCREAKFSRGGLGVEQAKGCQNRSRKVILGSVRHRRAGRDCCCWCLHGVRWCVLVSVGSMGLPFCFNINGIHQCCSPHGHILLYLPPRRYLPSPKTNHVFCITVLCEE
jgi:hypothetical protein